MGKKLSTFKKTQVCLLTPSKQHNHTKIIGKPSEKDGVLSTLKNTRVCLLTPSKQHNHSKIIGKPSGKDGVSEVFIFFLESSSYSLTLYSINTHFDTSTTDSF